MTQSGGIKRSFIKGNVAKKFRETAERVANINRTILVLDAQAKGTDTTKYKDDIRFVQFRIDELSGQLEENKNRLDLNAVLPKAPRQNWKNSKEETGRKKEVSKVESTSKIKLSESGRLFLEANKLFYGLGDDRNIDLAIDKYEQSARMGSTNASLALGKIFEEGIGVKADLLESFTHYRNAARNRHPLALYKMGELLEKGDGLEEGQSRITTMKQILGSYKSARDHGSTKAVVRLAQMYEKGEYGQQQDNNKALELYQSVVNEEDVAMNAIGSE